MSKQIKINDVLFSGESLAGGLMETMLNEDFRKLKAKGKFSEAEISELSEKHSWEKVLTSDYGFEMVMFFVRGCIQEYHDQLREKLLEQSIDIGAIDLDTPNELKEMYELLRKAGEI